MIFSLLLSALLAPPLLCVQDPTAMDQLKAWADDTLQESEEEVVYAQLRGHLFAPEAEFLVAMLAHKDVPRRNALLELLLQVPIEEARPYLLAFVKDETRSAGERGRIAEFLFLLDGHDTFRALSETIRPDAEPPYLRRVYAGWRESVLPSDLPILEDLATSGSGFASEYALQLWALNETNQEARIRIYKISRERDPNFRAAAWKALAQRGFDAEIADMLRAELNGGTAEIRNLARTSLLAFAGQEAYLEEYKNRAGNLSNRLKSQWMVPLAGLDIPEAQRLAMEWLLDGGWNVGSVTRQVVIQLSHSEEIDALLPVIFQHPDIPDRVLFPLALARSGTSEDAKAYLLARLHEGGAVMQMQIARSFAAQQTTAGLEVLRDIAESAEYSLPARSLARELLVPRKEAEGLVERWLQDRLPSDYEIAASWLRALAESKNASWREQAIQLASEAEGFEEEDEHIGLRLEVWAALGRSGEATSMPLFEQRLQKILMETTSLYPQGEAWDSLYRIGRDYPELNIVLEGLRRCAGNQRHHILPIAEEFKLEEIPSDLLLIASVGLARTHPQTAADWFAHLLTRDLPKLDRLRVQCLIAHRIQRKDLRKQAFTALLTSPENLNAYRRVIVEGFSPDAAAWVMLAERIGERSHLEKVEDGDLPPEALQAFTIGYAEDSILARSVDIAQRADLADLALQLALRRIDHSPLHGEAHAVLAGLQQAAGQSEKAQQSWARVMRLSPDHGALWTKAKAALNDETH